MQALLVSLVCHECAGFASRSCCRKPRAALAEARLPWAESAAPSGLKKAETEWLQRFETASYLSAIHAWHEWHEGTRGSGFELEESPKPRYDNPHIKPMIRGKSDAYFSWEINYNVVGQWLRIAGYNKIEAAHFLAAWIAKSPSKWKSLDLDRQTWFWIGYDYANARQSGWHPAGRTPGPKPGNYWWMTPPPASYPSRPQERRGL